MQFVREIVPHARKVGVLTDLNDPKAPPQLQELQAAGRNMDVNIIVAGVSRPAEIEGALQTLVKQRVEVAVVLQTSMLLSERRLIAESAVAKGLPTIYGYREHVLAGGLLSYGVDLRWCFHRGAYFVDRILRGAAPGDLPVEFPTKMLLTISLKTARTLGMTPSPMLLARADEIIE
jgi:putative ABC transport system substrate-binding protein